MIEETSNLESRDQPGRLQRLHNATQKKNFIQSDIFSLLFAKQFMTWSGIVLWNENNSTYTHHRIPQPKPSILTFDLISLNQRGKKKENEQNRLLKLKDRRRNKEEKTVDAHRQKIWEAKKLCKEEWQRQILFFSLLAKRHSEARAILYGTSLPSVLGKRRAHLWMRNEWLSSWARTSLFAGDFLIFSFGRKSLKMSQKRRQIEQRLHIFRVVGDAIENVLNLPSSPLPFRSLHRAIFARFPASTRKKTHRVVLSNSQASIEHGALFCYAREKFFWMFAFMAHNRTSPLALKL